MQRRSSRSCPFQFSAALIDQGQHLGARRIGRERLERRDAAECTTQTSQPAHERDRLATEDNRCRLDAIEQALRKIEDAALTLRLIVGCAVDAAITPGLGDQRMPGSGDAGPNTVASHGQFDAMYRRRALGSIDVGK